MKWPKALLIAGPTASGKSALAARLAQRLGGRVINADSMQVYRDLHVLTARPTKVEMAGAPHALYGTIDGAQNHSVSLWLADARNELQRAKRDGLLPIFVGGTGLYFKALTQGLSDIPPVPDAVRTELRAWAEGRPPAVLYDELVRRDPLTAARLRPSDPQRILRAIEVLEATGESLVNFQERREPPALDAAACIAAMLALDRDRLRARIDARFDSMILNGAVDEVRRLDARHLDPGLPVMRAIGVRHILRHLTGEVPLDTAIVEAKNASRQYIKRQETFVRHQLPTFIAIPALEAEARLLARFQSL